jgi:hypothetical protein
MCSDLFDGDGAGFTHFDAAFAAKAFVCVHRFGFSILHFKYLNRTNIDALLACRALVFVHYWIESHRESLLSMIFLTIS